MLATLSAGLGACDIFTGPGAGKPRVSSVDPASGATNVALSSNVRATLTLPGEGGLDVTTLSDTAVTLTDASGAAVPAKRTLEGNTIVLDPDADLIIDTSYTFNVTSAVETADGTALQPFGSSFSTGDSAPPPPGTILSAAPAQVIFTAGTPTGSDTQTLTLTNGGTEALNVSGLSVTGADAAQFAVADSSAFSLAAGESRELSLTFNSKGAGPQLAALNVQSNAPSLEVPLGGLGVEGQGGTNEPSLQWILDTYGLGISTGDDDPSTTGITDAKTVSNGPLGDEVSGQTFTKAVQGQPITAEVLAAFGVENDPVLDFGYYAAGRSDVNTALFNIQQTPTLNAQRLAPEVNATGGTVNGNTVTFDPGAGSFGLYSFWPTNRFFSERTVYTEDALNTFPKAIPHQVRTYPLPGEANAYVVATEEFSSGFDYNDIVVILRNVVPAVGDGEVLPPPPLPTGSIPGLSIRNQLGLPYSDRLVLERIGNVQPDPCDFELEPDCDPNDNPYEGITFPTTGIVELQNTGGSPLQLSLSFINNNLFVFPNGESTITVAPGETKELQIEFNPSGNEKGIYPAALLVESGGQTAGLELVGSYQTKPGGSREPSLIVLSRDLFGYKTDIGTKTKLPGPELETPLVGDEVRSSTWEAADPNSPVTALQLAAFHDCCKDSYPFELREPGGASAFATMEPAQAYGQSIYPRQADNESLTELSANPTGPFEVFSAGYSSNPENKRNKNRLGVRFWPLKDRDGTAVPNTYIVGQDFVITGCTATPTNPDAPEDPDGGDSDLLSPAQSAIIANCDYQDNVYILRNVRPAN